MIAHFSATTGGLSGARPREEALCCAARDVRVLDHARRRRGSIEHRRIFRRHNVVSVSAARRGPSRTISSCSSGRTTCADYGRAPIVGLAPVPGLIGLSATAVATLVAWRIPRWRWFGFLGAWFFLLLAPSSSIVPIRTEIAAERRVYLALAAVVTLVVIAVSISDAGSGACHVATSKFRW